MGAVSQKEEGRMTYYPNEKGKSGIPSRVLITGVDGPICAEAARQLERTGYAVVRVSQRGLGSEGIVVDFDDDNTLDQTMSQIDGELDGIVLGHSLAEKGNIGDITNQDFRRVLDYNLISYMVVLRALSSKLRRGGSIVIVSSTAALDRSVAFGCHYTMTKYALHGMVRHLAFEFGDREIRVNAACPGWVEGWGMPKEIEDAAKAEIPLRRIAKLSEISDVISFLIGPGSSYVTGTFIPVSGGFK
jgi:NAD(P)-dependent dehydrogenase (short-subunit alcohol dehydrogenase family)